jgi:hypothetical protein
VKSKITNVVALVFVLIFSVLGTNPTKAVTANPNAVCGSDCVLTFAYSGDYYSWTVPSGVTSILVDAFGAQGGKSSCTFNTVASGGLGGRVQSRLTTTPGEILHIYVGGQGNSASQSSNTTSPGWNGGGKGGYGNGGGYWGSGGGGATDVRTSIGVLSTRLLVAGAGGGAACQNSSTTDNGGAGGGLTGGVSAQAASGSTTSFGGTQSAGGAGITWTGWGPSKAGALGLGGDAQLTDSSSNSSQVNGGGGGGAGYYGGGGGSWVGGGGGSSFTDPVRASNVTHTQGSRTGNGLLTITYAVALPVITTSIAGNVSSVSKGQIVQLTANVDQAGKVTFLANGKRIPGCISISTAGGNVFCNWKSAGNKPVQITATISQGGSVKSVSSAILVSSVRRTNKR